MTTLIMGHHVIYVKNLKEFTNYAKVFFSETNWSWITLKSECEAI